MKKLVVEMKNHDVTFVDNSKVFNVVSKAVLPEECATELLDHDVIGEEIYQGFIKTRLQGDISIWSPIKKRKLKTFKTQLKVVKKKVNGRVIQLKEEKSVLSRFLITSRKRPELGLEYCLGNFEFTVVPRALFSSNGEPHPCLDKAKLLHHIEELGGIQQQDQDLLHGEAELKVLVIDGMAVLNQIHKDKDMETCKVRTHFEGFEFLTSLF